VVINGITRAKIAGMRLALFVIQRLELRNKVELLKNINNYYVAQENPLYSTANQYRFTGLHYLLFI